MNEQKFWISNGKQTIALKRFEVWDFYQFRVHGQEGWTITTKDPNA